MGVLRGNGMLDGSVAAPSSSRHMALEQEFVKFLLVKCGLRFITAFGYVKCIKKLIKETGEQTPTPEQTENFIFSMHERQYSYSYIHNTITAIQYYFRMNGSEITLGRQRKPKPIIKDTLTHAEIVTMFHHTKNIREKAILAVLTYSGIRNSELCNLKVQDIDLGVNTVRIIKGKGVKDGISMISSECSRIVGQYLMAFPRGQEEYLFTTLKKNNQYAGCDLRKLIKVIARRASITKRVYPHLLRHSISVLMLENGGDIFMLQKQLRHSLIETTLIYLRSIPFVAKNEYQKCVPNFV